MKRYFITALLLFAGLHFSFLTRAQEKTIPLIIKESFQNKFSDAHLINWSKGADAYIATVIRNNTRLYAYFSEDGDLKGLGQEIKTELLPVKISYELARKFPGYFVSKVYEYDCLETGPSYYVSLRGPKINLIVRCNINSDLSIIKRTITTKPNLIAGKE